jgi:biopolymer transport protein ExbB
MLSRSTFRLLTVCVVALAGLLVPIGDCLGQDESSKPIISQEELQELAADPTQSTGSQATRSTPAGLNLLKLLIDGGVLMIPIGLMSLLVVAVAMERSLALRRNRLFPRRLRREIRRAIDDEAILSPAELYRTAELLPSAASRVLMDIVGKVGRSIPEIETTISESIQREADRLYSNVRWLNLAAAVSPLLGLLGTVWGMIIAFYNTTQLTSGTNRAEFLAEGIYVALVTTLAGLVVAIPAAILAHYFEGKITKNLGLVDVELRRLTARLEHYEGRTRFDITSRGVTARPLSGVANSTQVIDSGSPTVRSAKIKL